jgi:hypothetical protein
MFIQFEETMITGYVITALSALILGGAGGAWAVHKINKNNEPDAPIVDVTSEAQQEIILQLTDIDLLKEPCSTAFIEAKGDLLCREMLCRMMTRGIDAQTSGQECEQISNIANTKIMRADCSQEQEGQEECYRVYRERK